MVMGCKGCLLPLAFPLIVLVVGSGHLAISMRSPSTGSGSESLSLAQDVRPDYSKSPPGTYPTCRDAPALANLLITEGSRIGITVKEGQPELPGKDATYRAESGRLGTITIRRRPMSPVVRCRLISHEFIHVLQHLHGDLRGVPPLGWSNDHLDPIPQEAEAYGHQQRVGYVLSLLQQTKRPD